MKKSIFIATLVSTQALALDCRPHLHLTAFHVGPDTQASTPGLGVFCRESTALVAAGLLQNSIGQVSKYASVGWQPLEIGGVKVGGFAGLIDGYKYKNGTAFPFAGAIISVPVGLAEVQVQIMPKWDVSPLTVAFSVTFKFH